VAMDIIGRRQTQLIVITSNASRYRCSEHALLLVVALKHNTTPMLFVFRVFLCFLQLLKEWRIHDFGAEQQLFRALEVCVCVCVCCVCTDVSIFRERRCNFFVDVCIRV
jgi:hypothetical protein